MDSRGRESIVVKGGQRVAAKKSGRSTRGKAKVAKVMREYKQGGLKSGGRRPVKSRKQAVAIALSEARRSGADIPPKKKSTAKRKATKKSTAKKSTAKKASRKRS